MDRNTPWDVVIAEIISFNKEYQNIIKGASAQEVLKLENLCGGIFPVEYKIFLERMGVSLGFDIATADFSIETILAVYSDSSWSPPKDVLFIGKQQDDENAFDVCMSLRKEDFGRILRVCFVGDASEDRDTWEVESYYEALSLQGLIYSYAFHEYRLGSKGPQYMFIPESRDTLDLAKIERIFCDLGFVKLRLFDDWEHFYENESSVITYRKPTGTGSQIILDTVDDVLLKKFTSKLRFELEWACVGEL